MSEQFNLFSFSGRMRILHATWFAFFLTFVMWFNHAPLMASIKKTMGLSPDQVKTLLILNVAFTIPARIIIGILVDKLGPKRTYSSLLIISSFFCFWFAAAQTYEMLALSRFFLGFVGAGFVIGIRMIGEWFPAKQTGTAGGIYGGWGNFGSAGAAMILPVVAMLFGGDDGWRYAVASTGVVSLLYGVAYFFLVSDTPKGSTYFKPKKAGAMEVSNLKDLVFYILMNIPMYLALALLAWKLMKLGVLSSETVWIIDSVLVALYLYQTTLAIRINKAAFNNTVPSYDHYKFKQVAILDWAYLICFGSELAVVSMLPMYFKDTFSLTEIEAGLLASSFALMNLMARPGGGWISDKYGRKLTLIVLLFGLAVGYVFMAQITSEWSIALAVLVTLLCSFCVSACCGAVFAVIPLIKRRLTGQIAGMAGAYGNIGGVTFLTIYSFVEPTQFFMFIAATSFVGFLMCLFLDEPRGTMSEVLPDGTVQVIELQ
jgi:NNP family nitrate/nitrite transporter-like MFS transporter